MTTEAGGVTPMTAARRLELVAPGTGLWHQIPAGRENLRVHRRFFKDLEAADTAAVAA
jgi:hypothetical protein